jgi:hypothetical protein
VCGPERAQALGKLVPPAAVRPFFRPLANFTELFRPYGPREPFEFVQDLCSIGAMRVAKRRQALDESRTVLYGFCDQIA